MPKKVAKAKVVKLKTRNEIIEERRRLIREEIRNLGAIVKPPSINSDIQKHIKNIDEELSKSLIQTLA